MATLREWIEKYTDGEPIEAVMLGAFGWDGFEQPAGLVLDGVKGKVLSLEEAIPYISYEFDDGFGIPECSAIVAYTKTWIISVSQYEGSTSPFRIARNPYDGFVPTMPGGYIIKTEWRME